MITLPPVPRAAAACREWSRQTMTRWRLSEAATVVEQLTSELVTNSIEHADSVSVMVLMMYAAGVLRMEVRDHDPTNLPVLKAPAADEIGGRGLMIVEALSDRWGVRVSETGKSVWCELAVPLPSAPPRTTGTQHEAGQDG